MQPRRYKISDRCWMDLFYLVTDNTNNKVWIQAKEKVWGEVSNKVWNPMVDVIYNGAVHHIKESK